MKISKKTDKEIKNAAEVAAQVFEAHQWHWGSNLNTPNWLDIHHDLYLKVEKMLDDPELEMMNSGRIVVYRNHWGEGEQSLHLVLELGEIYLED